MNLEKFVKDYSIEITEGTLEQNINSVTPTEIPVRKILDKIDSLGLDPCYASNGAVVAFYDGSKYYVSPLAELAEKILRKNGFAHISDLYVPFSGFSKPDDENLRKHWETIKNTIPK